MIKLWSVPHTGEPMITPERIDALVLDFDDTITSPFVRLDRSRARLHDISRVLTAQTLGVKWDNERLMNVDADLSDKSYRLAHEPTLDGSIAWLFRYAGIFDSYKDYDREDPRLVEFKKMRSELHLKVLKDHARLNPGAIALLRHARDELPYGTAIASMATMNEIDVVFDKFDLDKYIPESRIITRDIAKRPKPDREVNDLAFHSFNIGRQENDWVQRQHVVGVDDSIGGLKSVAGADLYPIGLSSNLPEKDFADSPAVVVFSSLYRVRNFIKTVNAGQRAA